MLLAGDVGGTKTRLSLYDVHKNSAGERTFTRKLVQKYDSRSATTLEDIVERFLAETNSAKDIEGLCVGIPGPVVGGEVKATNLPWVLSEKQVSARLKIAKVRLVNDLVATAAALPYFAADDLVTLHPGKPDREKQVFSVLAPGTGLGQGYLFRDPQGNYHPLPSEGGHVEFAPKDELEFDLLKYMQRKLKKRVSIERLICGPGLVNIYTFLKDLGYHEEPAELAASFVGKDQAAVIAETGMAKKYEICDQAISIFAQLLGSQAGDVTLTYLSTGGCFLGGGIPPKILAKLQEGPLVKAYLTKGRLSPLVEATPLYVIKDDHAALLGAASIAATL